MAGFAALPFFLKETSMKVRLDDNVNLIRTLSLNLDLP